jgi:predicted methyltransferase
MRLSSAGDRVGWPAKGREIMRSILVAAVLALAVPAVPALAQANPALEQALAHDRRAADRARDAWRHPAETLSFFRVEPGMTVVDYMPSGGWYTRVLAPYLGPQGTYIGLNPELHPGMTGFWDSMRGTADKFPAQAAGWVGEGHAKLLGANANDDLSALAGTVDRALIFREIHNMRRFGFLHGSLVTMRRLLKDDGLLGVVQHRAKADAPVDYVLGDNGYQREEDVIKLFEAYGFELVDRSEINANPADPANWEGGVWTLPPGYRGAPEGSARRAELDAIGESDRMTLLFRKRK